MLPHGLAQRLGVLQHFLILVDLGRLQFVLQHVLAACVVGLLLGEPYRCVEVVGVGGPGELAGDERFEPGIGVPDGLGGGVFQGGGGPGQERRGDDGQWIHVSTSMNRRVTLSQGALIHASNRIVNLTGLRSTTSSMPASCCAPTPSPSPAPSSRGRGAEAEPQSFRRQIFQSAEVGNRAGRTTTRNPT